MIQRPRPAFYPAPGAERPACAGRSLNTPYAITARSSTPARPLNPIPPAIVLHTIARVMPDDAVIVEESPSHRNDPHNYLPIRRRNGCFTGASGGPGYSPDHRRWGCACPPHAPRDWSAR